MATILDGKYTLQNKFLGAGAFGSVVTVKGQDGNIYALKRYVVNSDGSEITPEQIAVVQTSAKGRRKKKARAVAVQAPVVEEDPNAYDMYNKLRSYSMELSILMNTDHPNVMMAVDAGILEESTKQTLHAGIVTPIYNITLEDIISRPVSVLDYDTIKYFSAQLVSGLAYLSQIGVVHRDIKPENLMIDQNRVLKIVDFGEAISTTRKQSLEANAGTEFFKAPEFLLQSAAYDERVDTWAAGCVIVSMFKGDVAFYEANTPAIHDVMLKMTEGDERVQDFGEKDPLQGYYDNLATMKMVDYDEDFTPLHLITNETRREQVIADADKVSDEEYDHLNEFLVNCFVYKYEDRPSAESLVELPWISKYATVQPPNKHHEDVKNFIASTNAIVDKYNDQNKNSAFYFEKIKILFNSNLKVADAGTSSEGDEFADADDGLDLD